MATLAVEVAAEAAKGFEATSAEEASAEGVDTDALSKDISGALGLASAVDNLLRTIRSTEHNEELDRRKRRLVGIVLPEESRSVLVVQGKIPAYYSESHINFVLLHNKLPFGWSAGTTVIQGFSVGIRNGELRQQLQNESQGIINELKLVRRSKTTTNNFNRILSKLRMEKRLEELKSTLV